MPHSSARIASLIGSRICHDLISPVGAVVNGLELLELSFGSGGEEMSLVAESAGNASARLRFFRIAFGEADPEQRLPAAEVAGILTAVYGAGRTAVDWQVGESCPRPEVKAAFLAILCAEKALRVGGQISIARNGACWHVAAEGAQLAPDPALWAILEGAPPPDHLRPDAVQFLLLPAELARQSRNCAVQVTENRIEIHI